MKNLSLAVLMSMACAGTGVAGNVYWKGGDGRWNDPAMWSPEGVPTAESIIIFEKDKGGCVELDGDCVSLQILFSRSGKDFPDAAPVTFHGGGTVQTGNFNLYTGRELTVTGATVRLTGTIKVGDENGPGRLEIQEDGVWDASASRNNVYANSTFFVNGGLAMGNLTVVPNGTFRMTSGTYRFVQKDDGLQTGAIMDVTGGTVIFGSEMRNGETYKYDDVGKAAFFPDRPGKTLVVDSNNTGNAPIGGKNVALGLEQDTYRLSGTLVVTNVTGGTADNGRILSMTNATYYGGGTMVANRFLSGRSEGLPQYLGLSRFELGEGFYQYGKASTDMFLHGPTTLAGWADWKRDSGERMVLHIDGPLTVETDDCRTGDARNIQMQCLDVSKPGASLAVTGCGTADVMFEVRPVQYPLAGLSVGDGTSLALSNDKNQKEQYWVEEFAVGAGGQVTVPFKCLNAVSNLSISCIGSSQVAADARMTALCDYASVANNTGAFYHVYSAAPGSAWPDPAQWTLQMNGTPENPDPWEMHVVGPTVYLCDGKASPSTTNDRWTGEKSGLFSDVDNWSNRARPTASGSLWMTGTRQTVVTNDIGNVGGKGVRIGSDAGPFVIRGQGISVTRSSTGFGNAQAAVYHVGSFPAIFECPITGTVPEFWIANEGYSYIAFMNTEALSLAGKTVQLRGRVIIGGAATAKNLHFQSHWTRANESLLALVGKGTLTLTEQTAAFTNSAAFSVGAGTKLTISGGSFRYAKTELTHRVDGLLDLQVPFGPGTDIAGLAAVDIGFAGTGVVQVASVKSSVLGSSRVKASAGVTLSPAGDWTTVTADGADAYLGMSVPDWGKAAFAPRGDCTYGPASGVTPTTDAAARAFECGDYSELTVESDHAVAFADPLVFGVHAKLVKKGAGRLAISAADVLAETVELEAGTLALSAPETVGSFAAAEGTTLELAAGASVTVTDEDLSLDGLTVSLTGDAPQEWTTLFTVAPLRTISGMPTLPDDVKAKFVVNDDGSTSLVTKARRGMMLLLR